MKNKKTYKKNRKGGTNSLKLTRQKAKKNLINDEPKKYKPQDNVGKEIEKIYQKLFREFQNIKDSELSKEEKKNLREEIIYETENKVGELLYSIRNKKFSNYSRIELLALLLQAGKLKKKYIKQDYQNLTLSELHRILHNFLIETDVENAESATDAIRLTAEREK